MDLEEIKQALFSVYGIESEKDYSFESGCYLNGKWLSIQNVIRIIEKYCD